MGIFDRFKRNREVSGETTTFHAKPPEGEMAVFIMPDRAKEILSEKKDVTIDDLLDHG